LKRKSLQMTIWAKVAVVSVAFLPVQCLPQNAPVPGPAQSDVQQHIQKVISCLPAPVVVEGDPHSCTTLAQQMAALHVPGVSIAVVHNGSLEWAQGFGVRNPEGAAVDTFTLFQAGSISKPVAAMAALVQVQNKKLPLDADINSELIKWKVPESTAANGKPVTLRALLTHTAGFTVHGFPGYATGAPVPTLVQVLNGEKPANTPPIRLESEPGSKWNYSGGGYVVMEQALLDITRQPFPKLMHDTVLGPIGMTHSTYEQPLPANLQSEAATPYRDNGAPVPGGAHTYPEMTAAGLWTTPSDLARYCIEVERSLEGKANHVLSQDLTQQMVTPGKGNWGLGLQIGGSSADPYFSHGGVNDGFESLFVAYEHHGDGAVVMTNAQGGIRLADQIMRSIGTEYGWPDYHAAVHATITLPHETLARYIGAYQMSPGRYMTIRLGDEQLISRLTGQRDVPLFAEADGKFFPKVVEAELDFVKDPNGKVTALVLHQNGHDVTMARLGDAQGKRIVDEGAAQAAAAAKRFKDQQAAPGSEAAIRRNISELQAGEPKYDLMSPGLAEATRAQLPGLKTMFANFGAVKSVTFKGVAENGADIYTVEFEHGSTEWHIMMSSDGKIESLNFRPN
jgi:CubicO group peptidase (beta-lactamase class C family)